MHAAGIAYESKNVDIPAGAHKAPEYLALNPSGQVPTLQHGSSVVVRSKISVAHRKKTHKNICVSGCPGYYLRLV